MGAFMGEHAPEKILAEGHAARRGRDGERQFAKKAAALGIEQSGGGERLTRGGNGEPRGAGKAADRLGGKIGQGREAGAGGVMAAAAGGVEEIERRLRRRVRR